MTEIDYHDVYKAVIDGKNAWLYRKINMDKLNIHTRLPNDPNNNTLLHLAIMFKNKPLINKLIDEGVDLNITNTKGWKAFDLLSISGMGEIIDKIITSYDQDLKDQIKENEACKQKLQALESEVDKLKTAIESHKEKAVQLEREKLRYKDSVMDLKREVVQLRDRKRKLDEESSELQMVKRRNITLEEKCIKLEEEKDKLKASVENLIAASRK
jgi:hypothetical protein